MRDEYERLIMVIFDKSGTKLLELTPDDGSYRYRAIKNGTKVILYYSLTSHVEIPIDSYIEYQGQRYYLWLSSNFKKKGTRNFEYTVEFGGDEGALRKYKLKDTTVTPNRLKFSIVCTPKQLLQLFVDNLNLRDSGWKVGKCIELAERLFSFNNEYIIDALNRVSGDLDTEYDIANKTLNLWKIEYNKDTPLALSYGKGNGFLPGTGRTNIGDKQPVSILFVEGGERNIDASKYGSTTLLLPRNQELEYEGRKYRTSEDGTFIYRVDKVVSGGQEDSYDGSANYPSRIGTVSEAIVVDEKKNFYDIKDSSIPAALDYSQCRIAGQKATIKFESGRLAGREFDIEQTDDALTGYIHAERRFKIVPAEIEGQVLPNSASRPSAGDKYAIFGIALPTAYICDNATKTGASWDMFREAVRVLYEKGDNQFSFTGELDSNWSKKRWLEIGGKILPGSYILFSDTQYQPEGISIRITGVKDYINKPHSPKIELSNVPVASGKSSQIDKIYANEVINEDRHKDALSFTMRRWRDAIAMQGMLEKVFKDYGKGQAMSWLRTMSVLVGHESLQYRFVDRIPTEANLTVNEIDHTFNYDQAKKVLSTPAGIIQHMTIGIDSLAPSHKSTEYKFWNVAAYTSPYLDDTEAMYLYIRCSKSDRTGSFLLSKEPHELEEGDYYYFLCGALTDEIDGQRSFSTLYGFSEIGPGWMRLNKIINTDGTQYWDMLSKAFRIGDDNSFLSYDQRDGLVLKGSVYQSPSGDIDYPEVDRGAYSPFVKYYPGDKVSFDGNVYKCVSETAPGTDPTNTRFWKELVVKGEDGKPGADGSDGRDGIDGADGKDGAQGPRGDRGPRCTYRGDYDSSATYNASSKITDIVSIKNSDGTRTYYVAKVDDNEPAFKGKPPTNTAYWDTFGANFSSVATDLLMARKIAASEIDVESITSNIVKIGNFVWGGNALVGINDAILVVSGAASIGYTDGWAARFSDKVYIEGMLSCDSVNASSLDVPKILYKEGNGVVFNAPDGRYPFLGVRIDNGNGIYGWNSPGNIANLYINKDAASTAHVYITNYQGLTSSDIRLKSVFFDIPDVLDKLEGISAFYYTMKEDEDKILRIGVSAQAVREVLPEAVHLITPDDDDSYYGVDYIQMLTAFGINGIKELHAKVKALEKRVEELENR